MIKKGDFYTFEIFRDGGGLVQAVSTRALGDMTDPDQKKRRENREKFLNLLGLDIQNLVMMEQVHGKKMRVVGKRDRGREIKGVDGLVTGDKNVVLGVKTADCVPLVAFEPISQVLGVAHVGWQGAFKKVGGWLLREMTQLGARPDQILVGFGPHIGVCCYQIDQERAGKFTACFNRLKGVIEKRDQKLYLNLEIPLIFQLNNEGVLSQNIDKGTVCTICDNDRFFSFRKEGRPFGEFLTVAALRG